MTVSLALHSGVFVFTLNKCKHMLFDFMMTIEIIGNRLTLNNVDPFLILILLGDKVIDKSVVSNIASPDFSIVVRPSDSFSSRKSGVPG